MTSTTKKPEDWVSIETEQHKRMYKGYCGQRVEHALTHEQAVMAVAEFYHMKETEMENISKVMHWRERYERDYLNLPEDTSQWGKEDYREFVKSAVDKINAALKGSNLENGITNAKDLKAAVDALEKLARLDLVLMGEASERIVIDVNKRPDEMTDSELAETLMLLQKRIPQLAEEEKEATTDDGEEDDMT